MLKPKYHFNFINKAQLSVWSLNPNIIFEGSKTYCNFWTNRAHCQPHRAEWCTLGFPLSVLAQVNLAHPISKFKSVNPCSFLYYIFTSFKALYINKIFILNEPHPINLKIDIDFRYLVTQIKKIIITSNNYYISRVLTLLLPLNGLISKQLKQFLKARNQVPFNFSFPITM
jgi:hypothetical protein